MFERKYPESYYRDITTIEKMFHVIPKREVKAIIRNYGLKPYRNREFQHIRMIYDETTKSYQPRSKHTKRGNHTYQLAIYQDTLIIRELNKHISKLNKRDLEEFRQICKNMLKNEIVFITDKRFARLRLDSKYYEVFDSKQEHNLIHRIIANTKNYIYRKRTENYTKAWKLTAKAYNLKLILIN